MNGDMITIYDNETHIPVLWSHLIPATIEGKALHNVQNAMFATAMAYSFNVDLDNIRHGLRTFDTNFFQAPGRTNVFDEHPFKVILDYAHNPAAFQTIADLVDKLDISGRRIVVVASPGDRRDEDIVKASNILAGHFDYYICRDDDNLRKRKPGEVPKIMQQGFIDNGVEASNINLIPDEVEATDSALNMAEQGDLVMIFGDNINRSWKQIIYFNNDIYGPQTINTVQDEKTKTSLGKIIDEEDTLIRDERGVRLSRNEEIDND
jgi:cyanophycin synthetase